MDTETWVDLKYRGKYFGDKFKISTSGKIKNINSTHIVNWAWNNRKCYSMIYYKGKTYRISIGEAQTDSGLPRSIFDKVPMSMKLKNESKANINIEMDEYITTMYDSIEKKMKYELDMMIELEVNRRLNTKMTNIIENTCELYLNENLKESLNDSIITILNHYDLD